MDEKRCRLTTLCLASSLLGAAPALSPAGAQEIIPYRVEGLSIPDPLTETHGNPRRGRDLVSNINKVPCLICHQMPIPEEPDHGEIGPSLTGVGSRLTPGELRLRVVDSSAINPTTIMPSYHRVEGLHRVGAEYRGRSIYTAQQVEDVVAYLSSLVD